jgi:YD repeat-containing protein
LYPTTVTNALGQTTTYTYDFNTGQVTSSADPNTQATTYGYYPYGLAKSISYPDGGSTQYTYSTIVVLYRRRILLL